ncbi:MAG: hypothetical protein M3081_11480, partial [Gemmatimonadota bacterium]|nr:hypothetical protein [Gemmatimonadota bacterium]
MRAAGRTQSEAGVSAGAADRRSHKLSWAVGAIAFIALAAFVVTQRSVESGAADGQAAASSAAPLSADAGRPPDISSLTPRERAERLYDRAMMAKEAGKPDSATFFATMATMAYGQLDELNLDDRYDLGRVALLAGSLPLASAEADTILAKHPTHLLGLMLAEDAARALGDERKAQAAHATLVASGAKEQLTALPEYRQHATEIAAALKSAGVA